MVPHVQSSTNYGLGCLLPLKNVFLYTRAGQAGAHGHFVAQIEISPWQQQQFQIWPKSHKSIDI